jgi:hypothetical protein
MVADVLDGAGRHQLITAILADGLDWGDHLRTGADIPDALAETIADHGLVVRPDLAFSPKQTAGRSSSRSPSPGTSPLFATR